MENTSLLNNETLPELEQLVEDYPYFHTARILYLKNLAVLNDMKFGTELKKTAIYIPDRRMLYMFIEEIRLILKEPVDDSPESEDPFKLIDQFLQEKGDPDPGIVLRLPVSDVYFPPIQSEKPDDDAPQLEHGDLIDIFLAEDKAKKQNRRWPETGSDTGDTPSTIWPDLEGAGGKSLDDSSFTETLAVIYIKQKRYEKALEIIRNLSLKYPEKNVYFADQIRFLEKLIINTKKYI
ncbi:MAG: hypothetical protein LBS88_02475 [Tannerellaceae bacterium]|nr:hypothetical protein [Tannerellaceae bacterium]